MVSQSHQNQPSPHAERITLSAPPGTRSRLIAATSSAGCSMSDVLLMGLDTLECVIEMESSTEAGS